MTGRSDPRGRIAPIPPGNRRRPWAAVIVGGLLGTALQLVVYVTLAPRLPPEVPSHYGPTGQVTASLSAFGLLLVGVSSELIVTTLVAAILFLSLRNGVVEHQHGPGFSPWLGRVLGVVAFAPAVPTTVLLLGDAGVAPAGGGAAAVAGIAFAAVPLLVLVAVATARRRPTRASAPRSSRGMTFECSSCGKTFEPGGFSVVFGPHIGGSVYLRCPVCGERGWDRRAGTPYFP